MANKYIPMNNYFSKKTQSKDIEARYLYMCTHTHTHTHTHIHIYVIYLEEGMATHSSVLAWRIPMDRGSWWATVHEVAKSWTRLSD